MSTNNGMISFDQIKKEIKQEEVEYQNNNEIKIENIKTEMKMEIKTEIKKELIKIIQTPQPSPQNNSVQQTPQNSTEEHSQPTTSKIPKKEGDCDDVQDSITATVISKGATSSPNENFRRIPNQTPPQRVTMVRPASVNRIATNQQRSSLQFIRQQTPQRPPQGLQHALGVRERESAKMLVILDNGEQRLITFTLPKVTCTVQELLDQVGIDTGADSNIECIENPSPEIDYIVKVGNFPTKDTAALTRTAENHIRQQAAAQQQQQQQQQQQKQRMIQRTVQPNEVEIVKTLPAVDAAKNLPPLKIVDGFLAVCNACGFSGVDHAKCERCSMIFTTEVKFIRMPGRKVVLVPNRTPIAKVANQERKDQLEAIQKTVHGQNVKLRVIFDNGKERLDNIALPKHLTFFEYHNFINSNKF